MEIILLALLGLIMGVVTSISGGAGVFAVPTMLAFGIPPINALTLNRTSDVGVVFGALRKYYHSKNIEWKLALLAAVPLGIGAIAGANFVINIPEQVLNYIILFGIAVGIFFLLKPVKQRKGIQKKSFNLVGFSFLLLVGFWSGALGMAGATFAVLVFVNFFKKSFLQARATDVAAAIPETLISTGILYFGSTVEITAMLTMFISSFIGAWIGSHLAVKHGNKFIKLSMILISAVMIIKVISDFF
ncbi:MAG: TSUP family transporter [Parcubacteria group bacterium]|nr:TSUP family transporter [Parcubacteria group bacterium]